jgi:hypothetical protein
MIYETATLGDSTIARYAAGGVVEQHVTGSFTGVIFTPHGVFEGGT